MLSIAKSIWFRAGKHSYLKEKSVQTLSCILFYKNVNGIHPERRQMPTCAPKDAEKISETARETHQIRHLPDSALGWQCHLKPQDGITHPHLLFPLPRTYGSHTNSEMTEALFLLIFLPILKAVQAAMVWWTSEKQLTDQSSERYQVDRDPSSSVSKRSKGVPSLLFKSRKNGSAFLLSTHFFQAHLTFFSCPT